MATDKLVSIRLNSDELERIQKIADKAGVSRHRMIYNLLIAGLETIEDLDKVGLIRLGLMIRNGQEFLQSLKEKKKLKEV